MFRCQITQSIQKIKPTESCSFDFNQKLIQFEKVEMDVSMRMESGEETK